MQNVVVSEDARGNAAVVRIAKDTVDPFPIFSLYIVIYGWRACCRCLADFLDLPILILFNYIYLYIYKLITIYIDTIAPDLIYFFAGQIYDLNRVDSILAINVAWKIEPVFLRRQNIVLGRYAQIIFGPLGKITKVQKSTRVTALIIYTIRMIFRHVSPHLGSICVRFL